MQTQFGSLKEAIVFLFAHSAPGETNGRTVLSRIAERHHGFEGTRPEFYDYFSKTLIDTVVEFDNGNDKDDLRESWKQAIRPGLEYLKTHGH